MNTLSRCSMIFYRSLLIFLMLSGLISFPISDIHAQSSAPDSSQLAQLKQVSDQAIQLFSHGKYDSVILISQELVSLGLEWHSYQDEVLGYILIANSADRTGDKEAQVLFAEKAHTTALAKLPPENGYRGSAFATYTNALLARGDYQQAIKNYQQILAENALPTKLGTGKTYGSLGATYNRLGDYQNGLRMYQQSGILLQQYVETLEEDPPLKVQFEIAENLYRQGRSLVYLEEYEAALPFLRESIRQLHTLGEDKFFNTLNIVYRRIEKTFYDLSETDSVELYLRAHRSLAQRYAFRYPEFVNISEAELHKLKGELQLSIQQHQLAVDMQQKRSYPIQAKAHLALAEVQLQAKEIQAAFETSQKGLQLISRDLSPDKDQLPTAEDVIYPVEAIPLLALKGKLWEAMADRQREQASTVYQSALKCYELGAELTTQIRRSFLAEGSKLHLAGKVIPMYEDAIQISLKLYEQLEDPAYLSQAFLFAEQGKAVVLYESLQQSAARQTMVPDSLLLQERNLKRDIAYYQTKIFEGKTRKIASESETISLWEQKLFELEESYQNLLRKLEEDFPAYHKAKYQDQSLTLTQFQDLLPNTETLAIEYFQGDSNIYAFAIQKNHASYVIIDQVELLSERLTQYQSMLTDPNLVVSQGFETAFLQEYGLLSYQLFQQLVQPALQVSASSVRQLILIPDGQLYHIPYEALLTAPPEESGFDYQQFPYLLHQYICTYEYSAALYGTFQGKKSASQPFGGFAPSYGGNGIPDSLPSRLATHREGLAPLLYTKAEVQAIEKIMGGDSYLGKEASVARFQVEASSYQILHLAMHALGDENFPDFSSLVFAASDSGSSAGFLYATDIEQMKLEADLAVLSACNTGSGAWVRGGGVISLGRAFRAAGCSNVLMSLWQADDQSTSTIMQDFYTGIKQGATQGEALRQAKITYIQQHRTAHPYFWGGFVLSGADRTLQTPRSWILPLVSIFLLLLVAAFWFIRSRKAAGTDRSQNL